MEGNNEAVRNVSGDAMCLQLNCILQFIQTCKEQFKKFLVNSDAITLKVVQDRLGYPCILSILGGYDKYL